MKRSHIVFGLALSVMAGCRPTVNTDVPSAHNLDLSRYVAVGNSTTAGSADGSLYRSSQLNSFPNILAKQFALVGGGEFNQPLLPGETGWPVDYSSGNAEEWRRPKLILAHTTDCQNNQLVAPVYYYESLDTAGGSNSVAGNAPFNNLGIPGVRVVDYMSAGYSLVNPYAARTFASDMETPMDQIHKIHPSFFTLWLGGNDVLGYAMSGGEEHSMPSHPNNISNLQAFAKNYDSVVVALLRNGAKGVLMNIPDIASLPFFTTIPHNGLMLDGDLATSLNMLYSQSGLSFTPGSNPFVIEDPDAAPFGYRFINQGEYILLSIPQDSMKCAGWGSIKPIPKRFVLTAGEVSRIKDATAAFNAHILQKSIDYRVAFADMNTFMKSLVKGFAYNGAYYSADYITGGAFSLDGIHPNPRGNALIANELIRVINSYYSTSVPPVDVHAYSGIKFP